jgi:biotin carboxyl carrier protein
MTTYFVTVGSNEYKVEIQKDQFMVNGQPLDLKLLPLNRNGLYLLELGRRKLEMLLKAKDRNQMNVMVDSRHMVVQVERGNNHHKLERSKGAQGDMTAPMPGIILSTRVIEGEHVEAGDILLTVESMKMQMEIRAPFAGTITALCVREGDKVEKGTVLVRIDG